MGLKCGMGNLLPKKQPKMGSAEVEWNSFYWEKVFFFVIPEGNVNATMEIYTGIYSKELFGELYQLVVNGRDNGCKMPLEKGIGEAPARWETLRSNLFS